MNIPLFIESLNEDEKKSLEVYFLHHAKAKEESAINSGRIPIEYFVNRIAHNHLSERVTNILLSKVDDYPRIEGRSKGEFNFRYVDEINKRDFLRLPNAGNKSWINLEDACRELIIPLRIK